MEQYTLFLFLAVTIRFLVIIYRFIYWLYRAIKCIMCHKVLDSFQNVWYRGTCKDQTGKSVGSEAGPIPCDQFIYKDFWERVTAPPRENGGNKAVKSLEKAGLTLSLKR